MDKLKWTKVGPGNAIWPKSGRFTVRLDHGGEGLVNGEKGEEIWPRSIVAIAGPIIIAEPDLELPKGWRIVEDHIVTNHPFYMLSVTNDRSFVRVFRSNRESCFLAITAAVKVLEE